MPAMCKGNLLILCTNSFMVILGNFLLLCRLRNPLPFMILVIPCFAKYQIKTVKWRCTETLQGGGVLKDAQNLANLSAMILSRSRGVWGLAILLRNCFFIRSTSSSILRHLAFSTTLLFCRASASASRSLWNGEMYLLSVTLRSFKCYSIQNFSTPLLEGYCIASETWAG